VGTDTSPGEIILEIETGSAALRVSGSRCVVVTHSPFYLFSLDFGLTLPILDVFLELGLDQFVVMMRSIRLHYYHFLMT